MKKLILFVGLLLLSQNYFAQDITSIYKKSSELKDSSFNEDVNKRPRYDIHAGISTISGLRLGGRFLFSKHLSFETSFGVGIQEILINSSIQTHLTLGLNIQFWDKKNITISFITGFINNGDSILKFAYLSPTIGVMILNKEGSHFFIRIGPYFESITKGSFAKGDIGVNIDLGYNFVF